MLGVHMRIQHKAPPCPCVHVLLAVQSRRPVLTPLLVQLCVQLLPDVMEVEVSPEGKWRPANSAYAWQDLQGELLQPLAKVRHPVQPPPSAACLLALARLSWKLPATRLNRSQCQDTILQLGMLGLNMCD